MKLKITFLLAFALVVGACTNKKTQKEDMDTTNKKIAAATPNDMLLLVGTYTSDEGSKGIYVY